jgi:GNAT superfamily N-acetyltransferase
VYIGEGLTVSLRSGDGPELPGEIVDLSPHGLGVALVRPSASLTTGTLVEVRHTGATTRGISHDAIVKHVGNRSFVGRRRSLVGLELFRGQSCGGEVAREIAGYRCPDRFPGTAWARSPFFFREWLHFRVTELYADGLVLQSALADSGLLAGAVLELHVMLPPVGVFEVPATIVALGRDETLEVYRVRVRWVGRPIEFLRAASDFLLLGDAGLTPLQLREAGFEVSSLEHAAVYGYASSTDEFDAVLALRLRAHQHENRLTGMTTEDMRSPYDAYSRHLTCRVGGRIVGYVRVIYVEGDPRRSQYVTQGAHVVPTWLWDAGFVEAGAGAVDPAFQRAGLFLPLMQHAARTALQSGHRYVLGACADDLLPMYTSMGYFHLETRRATPRPGWSFDSHLICQNLEAIVCQPPSGRWVREMASVVNFVGLPPA